MESGHYRNNNGRFVSGNPGGPGRPRGCKPAETLRRALFDSVTAVEVQAVICKLRELAPEAVLQPMTLIAITGYDDEEARMRSREAGFDAHLVKPVPLDVLVAILSRFGTEARRIGRSPGS